MTNNTTSNDRVDGRTAWAALDHMPPPIRRALHEGVASWDSAQCLGLYKQEMARGVSNWHAANFVCRVIRRGDQTNVDDFSIKHFGGQSPHTAAKATIQRYERTEIKREQE